MNRRVLLIEPNYKNKYPPMGLMKIATYFRRCEDDVRFFKGDLRDFAARLLCEEFYEEKKDYRLGKYFPNMISYIRTGKTSYLEAIPNFVDTELQISIEAYQKRYRKRDYPKFDIVGVTTLFTFYWKQTVDTIKTAKLFCDKEGRMLVGGIAATILPEQLYKETGVYPHKGLLDQPGVYDKGNTDIIDELPLDYSILYEIDYKYPASDAYFGYMTRGCPRRCAFCAVKTLEPVYKNYIGIADKLNYIDEHFGKKKDLLLMDNNVFASNCFDQIIDEIKRCGFQKGAKYTPSNEYEIAIKNLKVGYNNRAFIRAVISIYDDFACKLSEQESGGFYLKREELGLLYAETATVENILVFDEEFHDLYNSRFKPKSRIRHIDFNQGLDARLVTNKKMKKLAEVNIKPLRIAFDHYEQKDIYCKAIRCAAKYGIHDLSNYLLYNFEDKPEDLYYRMRINVDLCEELGVAIYSFPMKYHPINDPVYFKNRDYIGKHWNRKFIRAIQAVLNSTKGKVGPGVEFFEEAFGKDVNEFQKLLWMPETFIIFRRRYDANLRNRLADKYTDVSIEDCDLANEWWDDFCSLPDEKLEMAKKIIAKNQFKECDYECNDAAVIKVLSYYSITR